MFLSLSVSETYWKGSLSSTIIKEEYKKGVKIQITNNIRRLRFFAEEMTQQQLAEKTGVSGQTIIAIEAGKYSPSLDLAFRTPMLLE